MKDYFLNRQKSKSLTAQIRAMEQQIYQRQQAIHFRGDSLVKKFRQRIAAPTTLLLASGIGFLFGELTKRRSCKSSGTVDKSKTAGPSPLITALNLITTARTLYMALPMAWMLKASKQCEQSPAKRYRRAATNSTMRPGVKNPDNTVIIP